MSRLETSLTLFLFVLCVALSTQAPLCQSRPTSLVDEAAMWSKAQTRRAREAAHDQIVGTQAGEDISNSTNQVPKYIRDLYASLTDKQLNLNLENTIRALPMTTTVVCGQYNFSLASQIPSEESILRSELRLNKQPKVLSAYYEHRVNVYHYSTGRNAELVTSKTVSSAWEEEEVFDVLSTVRDWKLHMENHPEYDSWHEFRLEIVGESCEDSNLQFVHNSDADKQPLLVTYSYDPSTKAIDYQSILHTPENNVSAAPRLRRSAKTTRSSSSSVQPSCGIHELDIEAGHLESLDFFDGYTIIAPLKYNAGICRGICQKRYPFTFQHSSFVHLLINKNTFADKDYNFSQTCSPVQFDPIDILMSTSDAVVIKRFADMVIKRCECIDVVSFE